MYPYGVKWEYLSLALQMLTKIKNLNHLESGKNYKDNESKNRTKITKKNIPLNPAIFCTQTHVRVSN